MAKAFLKLVAEHIFSRHKDTVEKLCIVLPNKRAGLFLKRYLAETFGKTIWLPQILSAEELIVGLSGLSIPDEPDLVCDLYESYRHCTGPDAEPFDSFVKWGQLILQDFNEIDRYLADPVQLYENLKDIKVIENWSLGGEVLTEHQQGYLRFMNSLGAIYRHYTGKLLSKGLAYQGLAYREAVRKSEDTSFTGDFEHMIFCGFNALNTAEIHIFSQLFRQKKATMLWDADQYYLHDTLQEAGLFMRRNLELFMEKEPLFIGDSFSEEKEIRIIAVPKQMGQAQVVKQELQSLLQQGVSPDKIAVVLANEKLLWPVLQQLPAETGAVNITMEYPLRYTAAYGMIELLIQIHSGFAKQQRQQKTIYHKELTAFMRHPMTQYYASGACPGVKLSWVTQELTRRNLTFITAETLSTLMGADNKLLSLLQPAQNPSKLCERLSALLQELINTYVAAPKNNRGQLELEYLFILLRNFNRLLDILNRHPEFNDMNAFRQLFMQVVGSSTAPFVGEPLRGIQIMGVLETRTLDFDHVILVNANEGVLPSGKSINSFIPNDLKRAFGLPLYTEKDAVYAYHFYRLLQRASDVSIIYDSETDSFGKGEKSRFVTQLQQEMGRYNNKSRITESVAAYPGFPEISPPVIRVEKSEANLEPIRRKAGSAEKYMALSPSSIATFKDCSLKFYFRYGVHLKETEEVEESAEASTFGSILHLSLEKLYTDLTGSIVKPEDIEKRLTLADATVAACFAEYFGSEPLGKSILQQEVIKVYVRKLLKSDLQFVRELQKENQHLTLHSLEQEFTSELLLDPDDPQSTVFIRGKADRIDRYRGQMRIVDYKSSVKDTDRFVFEDFHPLFHDKNYDKQLQLIIYAWLLYKNGLCEAAQLRPCIVPFKVFSEQPKFILTSEKKPFVFSVEFFYRFEQELAAFIRSIFDMSLPFVQTDDEKSCEYCAYNVICNFHP